MELSADDQQALAAWVRSRTAWPARVSGLNALVGGRAHPHAPRHPAHSATPRPAAGRRVWHAARHAGGVCRRCLPGALRQRHVSRRVGCRSRRRRLPALRGRAPPSPSRGRPPCAAAPVVFPLPRRSLADTDGFVGVPTGGGAAATLRSVLASVAAFFKARAGRGGAHRLADALRGRVYFCAAPQLTQSPPRLSRSPAPHRPLQSDRDLAALGADPALAAAAGTAPGGPVALGRIVQLLLAAAINAPRSNVRVKGGGAGRESAALWREGG
jgi:hypothetical protein